MAKFVDPGASDETPDAWAAFERAVDVVVKAPPQHRSAKKREPNKSPPPGGDDHEGALGPTIKPKKPE